MAESSALTTSKVQVSESSLKSKALSQYRDQIAKQHLKCVGSGIQTLKNWIICGESLLEAKSLLPHGQFGNWLAENFHESTGLSGRTAQRYMRAATRFREFLSSRIDSTYANAALLTHLDSPVLEAFFPEFNDRSPRSSNHVADPNSWEIGSLVINAVQELLDGIECDPCSSSDPDSPQIGRINYTVKDNGLADHIRWRDTLLVVPGHVGDMTPWLLKALREMELGHLRQAVLCLPENLLHLPADLLGFPVALTPSPLVVTFRENGTAVNRPLPTRSLFVYMAQKPDVARFKELFRDIGVVFAPVQTNQKATLVVSKS